MNRNRHRVVFNAARGQRMVVAESAISGGGSASGETPAAPDSALAPLAPLGDLDICKPSLLRNLALHPLTLSIALALTLGAVFYSTANAQVVADPSAPGNQRPTILQTGNGLPQINIQTPSAAGVSRNTYSQFDVQSGGAVLNNSRTNVQTQTGGMIAGNPWLATGEARVILNEVNSSHPSQLNGYVEVAGRRAEVVIANPAGIQVNGGGFINAAGVTLAQLTGRRYLSGYANDETQFQALMDSGVAYAKQWNLIPGVALTAEQMALLTTDLVWLVERDVVLPNGTKTTALVPQLYVRQVPQGDFQASGALLAGNTVNLQIQQDLVNAGGRIEGNAVVAEVGRDLRNIGGLMQARSELLASAGRDITISSPTHTTTFAGDYVNQSRTELAGVGEMKVGSGNGAGTGAAGARLSIEAGGNLTLQGASVSNASANGSTTLQAGGNLRLDTVTVGSTDNTEYNAKNYQRHSQSQEVGSSVQVQGDLAMDAGNDVVARAAHVAATGDLSVQAGNDIRLEAGRQVSESANAPTRSGHGRFVSH